MLFWKTKDEWGVEGNGLRDILDSGLAEPAMVNEVRHRAIHGTELDLQF